MNSRGILKTSAKSAMVPIQSIGQDFIARYFNTIQSKPGAWDMDRFYDEKSKHVQLQAGDGRPEEAFGLDRIKRSIARMRFDRCAFAVDSVYTVETRPTRYTVVAVGRLTQTGRAGSRNFVHSTVVMKSPSTKKRRRYSIVRTVMKFIDRVVEDELSTTVAGEATKEPAATEAMPIIESTRGKSMTVKRTAIAENLPSGSGDKLSAPSAKTVDDQKPTVNGVAIRGNNANRDRNSSSGGGKLTVEASAQKTVKGPVAPIKDESVPSLIQLNQLKSFEDNNQHMRNIIKKVNERLIKLISDEKTVSNGDTVQMHPATQDGRSKDFGYGTNRKSEPRPAVREVPVRIDVLRSAKKTRGPQEKIHSVE